MKKLSIVIAILVIAGGAFIYFGGLERVTKDRVEAALIETGAPPKLASCMADRMVDRLSLNQLRKLERLRAGDGETSVPLSPQELMNRIRRVDDPEAIEVTTQAAAVCAIGSFLN